MLTITDIIKILFANDTERDAFIARTHDCRPPISGESFEEKLTHFFDKASDRDLQLVLAPFLRARIFKYLHDEETHSAKNFKQEFIEFEGAVHFNTMCSASKYPSSNPVAAYFSDLKNRFIYQRGNDIWNIAHHSDVNDNDYTPDCFEKYSNLKKGFVKAFQEEDFAEDTQKIWERIHQLDDTIIEAVKQDCIQDWNEELWQENCPNLGTEPSSLHPSPAVVIAPTEPILDCPAEPDPVQNFIQKKDHFIQKYGIDAWKAANSIPTQAFRLAYQLKSSFIQGFGNKQWLRIISPPILIERFEEVKVAFCKKHNQKIWDLCCNESDSPYLTVDIKNDFEERKNTFITNSLATLGVHNAWQESLGYPEIPVKSQELFTSFKAIFVEKWGGKDWENYLTTHNRSGEYATSEQLKILAKIFHFSVQITDISNTRATSTYFLDGNEEPNAPIIHFYYENNHYYIHEGGYSQTIGNGDCFYNGFAQWLRLLLKDQQPRRIMVFLDQNDVDVQSYLAVQRALHTGEQAGDSLSSLEISQNELQQIASAEEITINAIRKELELPLVHQSNEAFSKFILAKVRALIHMIRAKKLPFKNRITLLKKICTLAAQFGKQTTGDSNLTELQLILLYIANTTYLPHMKDVDPNWTTEKFKHNIQALQDKASGLSSHESFTDLSADILDTNFNCNEAEKIPSRIFHQQNDSPAVYNNTAEPEEDWLSAGLCIAGIFMIIASIIFMISLLLVATLSGLSGLGLFLMQHGLASIALSLGAVIGLSAPNTAILLATGASFITAGVGLTMFKDFAPRHLLSLDSFFPNLYTF